MVFNHESAKSVRVRFLVWPPTISALGIGGWWAPFVLTLHTVWSISVPIGVVESLFAERHTVPWLGKLGFRFAVVLLVVGGVLIRIGTTKQDPFAASSPQLITTVVLIVVVVGFALACRPGVRGEGGVPASGLVSVFTFLLGLGFMSAHAVLHDWTLVGA